MRLMMKRAAIGCEAVAVRAALRFADAVTSPWLRRRRLSPYVLLIAEASEAGVDHDAAVALAHRLLQPESDDMRPSIRHLQRQARRANHQART